MEKKTPLYECHISAGASMVPFAGYLMPVQYTDIIEEHMAVRTKAGLFDVSHMGEVIISGRDALRNINFLFTNDFTGMADGRVRYSPMCNPDGGVIDDLLIYRMDQDRYLVVVNASNREKDVEWMKKQLFGQVALEDISDSIAQIALQGPKSKEILSKLTDINNLPEKYYTFLDDCSVAGIKCLISQTGYTGEFGYELYCETDQAEKLWRALLDAGKDFGLIPCGLGARDTLRLEAAMPLYGHEMDDTVSPLETGLGFGVKLQKDDFIGKSALIEKGEPKITRVGLKVTGRGIIREHCPVFIGEEKIGETTSGTFLPYLNGAYAMALIDKARSAAGTSVSAEVRGRRIEAEIVPLPFYKKSDK
ncbi:MAG: glycine cleavage system aminomethyltransferase GcvT [Oscillospiraceae bacterium]|nr:glycine cleavage system aminomethyltransferase GcvT [Oscillospiraceae bacterium]